MSDMITLGKDSVLYTQQRDGLPEVVVYGRYAILHEGELLSCQASTPDLMLWSRSLLKPFQYLALAGESKTALEIPEEILVVASHSGEAVHLDAVHTLAKHWNLDPETDCICPVAMPMKEDLRWHLKAKQSPEERVYHPCIGKHLHYAHRLGPDYHRVSHESSKLLELYLRDRVSRVLVGVDSCGLATYAMTMADQLKLWTETFAEPTPLAEDLLRTWVQHPVLVGGSDRLDSLITTSSEGKLIAKEGADGLLMVAQPYHRSALFLKLSSGYSALQLRSALGAILTKHRKMLSPVYSAIEGLC